MLPLSFHPVHVSPVVFVREDGCIPASIEGIRRYPGDPAYGRWSSEASVSSAQELGSFLAENRVDDAYRMDRSALVLSVAPAERVSCGGDAVAWVTLAKAASHRMERPTTGFYVVRDGDKLRTAIPG